MFYRSSSENLSSVRMGTEREVSGTSDDEAQSVGFVLTKIEYPVTAMMRLATTLRPVEMCVILFQRSSVGVRKDP